MGFGFSVSSGSVVGRAFAFILALSLVFVVISSAILFEVGYRAKKAEVDREVQDLRRALAAGVANGLWDYDKALLKALTDGMIHFHYLVYAAVGDGKGFEVSSGLKGGSGLALSFPITRTEPGGGTLSLGTLELEVDSRQEFSDVTLQVLPGLALEALLLLLEAFVVLALFSRLAKRHLSRIAAYIRDYDVRPEAPPLSLDKPDRGDELDLLVRAYNGMRRDVEASREAESRALAGLGQSEERSRVLVEEAPDAIMMYDVDARVFIECNRRALEVFGRSREELVGADPVALYAFAPEEEVELRRGVDFSLAAAAAGEPVTVRRRVMRPGGEVIECEVRLNLLPEAGRRIVRVSYLDVTERVRAEEAMARSLREKEVLLHEVYHRTKNNMQLISAFLGLEADSIGDARLSSTLNEVIGRIGAMALVHQKLLDSNDISRIDLGDYVRDLVASIKSAYLSGRRGIEVSVEAESGIISIIDVAIPCGLVLNELVVNAAKHAFAGRESGSVRVRLSRGEPGTLALEVSDDGLGLPEGFDFRRDGHIGLQTVLSIVELQLHGSASFESGAGTTCRAVIRDDLFERRV